MSAVFRSALLLPLASLLLVSIPSCTPPREQQEPEQDADSEDASPKPAGEYLGQEPPGEEPELFAPGIVSTGMYERDLTVSSDGREIYFGVASNAAVTIAVTRLENGRWTGPEIAEFARDQSFFHFEPALSFDGKRIFFLSTRPPAGREPKSGWGHQNIWVADRREGGGWSEPRDLGAPINTDDYQYFPSLTRDGMLYYTHAKAGTTETAIYRSRPVDGEYTEPERLPDEVNGNGNPYNAWIAPDESYLIACVGGREDSVSQGKSNYYVFFRDDSDSWTSDKNLGAAINREGCDAISPSVSPDGKYLFFALAWLDRSRFGAADAPTFTDLRELHTNPRNGSSDIYWVSAEVVEKLR